MKLKPVEIGALLLIAVAAILGVIAVADGRWILVAAMALTIVGQVLAFRKARSANPPRPPR